MAWPVREAKIADVRSREQSGVLRPSARAVVAAAVACCVLTGAGAAAQPAASGPIDVQVDWLAEMTKGGMTMVALLALSLAMGVFIIERAIVLRRSNIAPAKLLPRLLAMSKPSQADEAAALCREDGSVLARVLGYVAEHRFNRVETVIAGAGDVGAREMRAQMQRVYPLAVVAGMAPLLGLLGTMIGMIESFQLVAIYGDEGGAAMLADSIAKALITTAVGLIIAIPALGAYHFFKFRLNQLMSQVETDAERLVDKWFHEPESLARRAALEQKRSERTSRRRAAPEAAAVVDGAG